MKRLITATLLVAFAGWAAPVVAQQQNIRRTQGGVTLNFQDVDLSYVISALAQTASINVVYSNMPQTQVTVRTSQPVSIENVATLIRQLAFSNGVSIVEGNGFMRLQGGAQAGEQQPRQLYIQRLQHARAPTLATTLMSLFGGGTVVTSAGQAASTLSQQLAAIERQNAQTRALAQAQQQQGVQIQIPQLRATGELEAPVNIVPDELTNSLLVRATAGDWQIIQQAIEALDLRPLQVVIEVLIVEVSHNDDLSTGMSLFAEKTKGDNSTSTLLPYTPGTSDFSLSLIRSGDVNIEATIAALSTTGDVHIISRPVVHAQNNQEANILVGSQRPFVQVSQAAATSDLVRNDVVSYRSVGTSLTITPTINEEGYVNLLVAQEVSSATSEVQFGAPVISTREATTQVLARTGQTVVIGGLVDHQLDKTRSGIPLLKDIPILGYLFGSTRETTANSELFLFLTPYIVATDEDADRVREEIETRSDLLQAVIPIPPITPPVIRTIPDTIRTLPDTMRTLPDTIRGGGR
jgi:general secretion pathway protein D